MEIKVQIRRNTWIERMNQPTLAYVAMSLPDGTQAEQFAAARLWGIAYAVIISIC
ncbi:hypothetical protein ANSO36C_03360 [Nostoc cf. commune SO-36]|uniref:Uncharacterized protein n=1 Tax=Nostoc cf. commune SO-36 TaxID=449208 RepID=A0ABM7YV70_NOSCO|nr:hypothetical protein [Nostoc commune]BDI14534.1 hypothetical protein ANSO36C_03360 [Nostoc cf. commune SO-36]